MSCGASTFDGVVEKNLVWRNWNGDVEFRPDLYFVPEHSAPDVSDGLAQLVHVAEKAASEQVGLKAVGACWAFEDVARSDAWTVCLSKLNRQLHGVVDGPAPALTVFGPACWRTRRRPVGLCTPKPGSASTTFASC